MTSLPRQFQIRVEGCPRCHGAHESVFTAFVRPIGPWTHYALCPFTQEPLLIHDTPHGRKAEVTYASAH